MKKKIQALFLSKNLDDLRLGLILLKNEELHGDIIDSRYQDCQLIDYRLDDEVGSSIGMGIVFDEFGLYLGRYYVILCKKESPRYESLLTHCKNLPDYFQKW